MTRLFVPFLFAAIAAGVVGTPVAEPIITDAPNIAKRATSCTFSGSSGASSASKSQKSCSTIILSDVAVPSGTTLDLSDLEDDTTVSERFSYRYYHFSKMVLNISVKGHFRRRDHLGLRGMGWTYAPNLRHRYHCEGC